MSHFFMRDDQHINYSSTPFLINIKYIIPFPLYLFTNVSMIYPTEVECKNLDMYSDV